MIADDAQGQLELNVFKPLIGEVVLQSLDLLGAAIASFTERCVEGIVANEKRIGELVERSLMLVTALTPAIGYEKAAAIARRAEAKGTTLREEALASGFIDASGFDALVRPAAMARPGA
jgi:fumarate hydratase class II